ncbi:hypothetical protein Bca101_004439 [Brassica carinata]
MSSDSPRKPEAQYLPLGSQHGPKAQYLPFALGIRLSPHRADETTEGTSSQLGPLRKEGGFDLDLTYITQNIIAMGFPAGLGKYKVYNLCSERLYDVSLFEAKEDIENVVAVQCKAGMARTGLMICSLLLYLKFFPTAEECMDLYNQKRCVDGKGLVLLLPSQIRYVKYFERILTYFNGGILPGHKCMLREFRFHTYWIRPSITISDHNGELEDHCFVTTYKANIMLSLYIFLSLICRGSLCNEKASQLVHGSKAEARENSAGSGINASSSESSEFKVMAADASVFSFGDEDDYESD